MKTLGAIILAAGKGKRMNVRKVNKVVMPLGNKPIILHATELLFNMQIENIVIVIGFAKESVINVLKNHKVIFVEQKKRLGTAHAVSKALKKIASSVENVLVIQGDDSAFYKESTIKKLIEKHKNQNAAITLLTIEIDNPFGLGRIIRNKKGKVIDVVEEKDANELQRKITEINPACYIFSIKFLKKYLKYVKKSSITGEYYLTSLIHIAIKNHESLATVKEGKMPWRGVNTPEELKIAEELLNIN